MGGLSSDGKEGQRNNSDDESNISHESKINDEDDIKN